MELHAYRLQLNVFIARVKWSTTNLAWCLLIRPEFFAENRFSNTFCPVIELDTAYNTFQRNYARAPAHNIYCDMIRRDHQYHFKRLRAWCRSDHGGGPDRDESSRAALHRVIEQRRVHRLRVVRVCVCPPARSIRFIPARVIYMYLRRPDRFDTDDERITPGRRL